MGSGWHARLAVLGLLSGLTALGAVLVLGRLPDAQAPWLVATMIGLAVAVAVVVNDLWHKRFGVDIIAVLALAGALLAHEFLAGALIGLMFATGQLLDRYAEFAGDPAPLALRHHYLAYRAFVRAKVACLRYAQHDASAARQARLYAGITLRHLRQGQVRLILVGGLPGTGKTTLAGLLADELGAVLISSDRIRKELAGIPPLQHVPAAYGESIYRPEHTERVYLELLGRAERMLARGESVVLDASWHAARHRALAATTATDNHSELVSLCCEVDAGTAAARLHTRRDSLSDADAVVAQRMAAEMQPWPEAVRVATGGSPPGALVQAMAALPEWD